MIHNKNKINIIDNEKNIKISENKKFITTIEGDNYMYINKKYINHELSEYNWLLKKTKDIYYYKDEEYIKVVPKTTIRENPDCLIFAEKIVSKNMKYKELKSLYSSNNMDFGQDYKLNILIANKFKENNIGNYNTKAKPEKGQAYAIVRTVDVIGKVPYHIAHVIFKDGKTRITIEVFAGSFEKKPHFNMYLDESLKYSFHSRFSKYFEYKNNKPITIILYPNNNCL